MTDNNRFAPVSSFSSSLNEEKKKEAKNSQGAKRSDAKILNNAPQENIFVEGVSKKFDAGKTKAKYTGRTRNRANFSSHQNGAIYAALDLGTNNCRLLVARQKGKNFKIIDGFSRIVRLGEGVSINGLLDENAIERTMTALSECMDKISRHKPKKMRLVATQACRGAQNSQDFLDRAKNELGLELEIIDQKTEAQLAVTGCSDLVDEKAKGALIFDIGGGSTELAWLDFRGGRPKLRSKMPSAIRSWQSLPVGVVSIAEKFGGKNVSPENFEEMVGFVSSKLKYFKGRKKLQDMIKTHEFHLIGTSGTVTTLAGLHLGLERYDRSKVDGLWMRNEEVVDTMRVLLNMPYERRRANSCIGVDRADLVIPGCAIFEAIRREWTTKNIRVADRGLREGMLVSMIEENRANSQRKKHKKNLKNG